MHGTLLWFSDTKNHGFLTTDEGDRVFVPGHAFAGDRGSVGRRRGLPVSFSLSTDDGEPKAADVSLLPHVPPRRARRHHRS
ncbi:MAG: cold shock domain-containing protein [Actinobacteria bacterium]|nr:cold shock domain-containing protein [Actinomycetota bacterium]